MDTSVRFEIKFQTYVIACVLSAGASSALAQQKGQWVPGQFGLNAGVIPEPGITYANPFVLYPAGVQTPSQQEPLIVSGSELFLPEGIYGSRVPGRMGGSFLIEIMWSSKI
jgi:hypothetical protein